MFSVFCPSLIFDWQPFFTLAAASVVASLLLPASINFFSFDCLHKYYGFSRVIVAVVSGKGISIIMSAMLKLMLSQRSRHKLQFALLVLLVVLVVVLVVR